MEKVQEETRIEEEAKREKLIEKMQRIKKQEMSLFQNS